MPNTKYTKEILYDSKPIKRFKIEIKDWERIKEYVNLFPQKRNCWKVLQDLSIGFLISTIISLISYVTLNENVNRTFTTLFIIILILSSLAFIVSIVILFIKKREIKIYKELIMKEFDTIEDKVEFSEN